MQGDQTLRILYMCIDKLTEEYNKYAHANINEEHRSLMLKSNQKALKALKELTSKIGKDQFDSPKEEKDKTNRAWLAYWEQDLAFCRKLIERQLKEGK